MTNRIGTYGASQQYLSSLLTLQARTNKEELQITSGLKSQTYSGIAQSANNVLNYQVMNSQTQQYLTNNSITSTKLQASSAAIGGIQTSITTFLNELKTFQQTGAYDQGSINQLQTFAFQGMQNIQAYLNTSINGEYLFSGGKTSTAPMQMDAASLSQLQAQYNGSTITYPTSTAASLLDVNITSKQATSLSFQSATGTITAGQADALTSVVGGSTITVANSTSNNNTYTVHSQAATNVGGAALGETTTAAGAGAAAQINYGPNGTALTNATTGNLNFAFAPSGQMTITPTTANTLTNLTAGTKFTVSQSTGNAWDGSYQVVSNINGVVTLANDESPVQTEQVTSTQLALTDTTTAATPALTAGKLTFSSTSSAVTGKTTVTLTAAGADFGGISVGDYVNIGGTTDHNGSVKVTAVTGNTISYVTNPVAVRVSQFLPQTGRSDVTISSTDPQGNQSTLKSLNYGTLSFSPTGAGGETITAATANSFLDSKGAIAPPTGSVMKLSSTSGVNDGVYTVVSNDGTNIVIKSNTLTTETNSTTATLSSSSYYKGDSLQQSQLIDQGRSVDIGTSAANPAFEKAIRAMGIIAQGVYGTAGGLDQNKSRISNAIWLLNDALQSPAAGTPPYGQESSSDISSVSQAIGYTQSIIAQKNTTNTQLSGYLQTQISSQENADQTTAVTSLLNDSNALQAAYQAVAQIRNLSLITYLK